MSRMHPVQVGHLVMGVAFLGIVAVWGLLAAGVVDLAEGRWLWPLPWLAAGAAGLIATVVRVRRADPGTDHPGTDHSATSPEANSSSTSAPTEP